MTGVAGVMVVSGMVPPDMAMAARVSMAETYVPMAMGVSAAMSVGKAEQHHCQKAKGSHEKQNFVNEHALSIYTF